MYTYCRSSVSEYKESQIFPVASEAFLTDRKWLSVSVSFWGGGGGGLNDVPSTSYLQHSFAWYNVSLPNIQKRSRRLKTG